MRSRFVKKAMIMGFIYVFVFNTTQDIAGEPRKQRKNLDVSDIIRTFAHRIKTSMIMATKYEHIEDEPMMASEDVGTYTGTISQTDALWALIVNQAKDVQMVLKERLDNLFSYQEQITPYTMEEINARIDESERQIETGDVVSGDDVHKMMRDYIDSLAV